MLYFSSLPVGLIVEGKLCCVSHAVWNNFYSLVEKNSDFMYLEFCALHKNYCAVT